MSELDSTPTPCLPDPETFVLLRNICDDKLMTRFKRDTSKSYVHTEDTILGTESAPVEDAIVPVPDDTASHKSGRSQRKRKINVHFYNPVEYVQTLKSRKKDPVVKKDPLEDIDMDKLVGYLEHQNKRDRESMKIQKLKRLEKAPKPARPQTAKTKKKKMRPYQDFQPAAVRVASPAAFSVIKRDPSLSPPPLTRHDSGNTETVDNARERPPVLEPCSKEKEAVKISFSGRCCKPNNAYFQGFYTDLSKIPALKNRSLNRKKPIQKGTDNKTAVSRVEDTVTRENIKQETFVAEENKPLLKKSFNQLKKERGMAKVDFMQHSLDNMMRNTEKDSQTGKLENRIPVYQDKIMETVKELAKEKKFVKFFQLNVGDKLIFIPTDGATVIPKAYVMDKEPKVSMAPTGMVVTPAGVTAPPTDSTVSQVVVKSEPVESPEDESMPKITSVFSLSSDANRASPEAEMPSDNQLETHSSAADEVGYNETHINAMPCETSASEKLKNVIQPDIYNQTPEADDKELQSLLRDTMTKIFNNRSQNNKNNGNETVETENTETKPVTASDILKHSKGQSMNPGHIVYDKLPPRDPSTENKPAILRKMHLPNFGKLEPLEKITSKALNQSCVLTIPQSNNPHVVGKKLIIPSSQSNVVLIPHMGKTVSSGSTTLFVTSTPTNNKLQSLLPKSKLQLVSCKPQTLITSTGGISANSSSNASNFVGGFSGTFSKSPVKPLLLFPNRANMNNQPALPKVATSQVTSNIHKPITVYPVSSTQPVNIAQGSLNSPCSLGRGLVSWSNTGVVQASETSAFTLKSLGNLTHATTTQPRLTSLLTESVKIEPKNDSGSTTQNKSEKQYPSNGNKGNAYGHEWVTVKSEPGDKHEFEAAILQNIKQERNSSETESETETMESSKVATKKSKSRRKKQFLEKNFTQVHSEETDTEERIRRLREKMRAQQQECESLKKTLLNESENTSY